MSSSDSDDDCYGNIAQKLQSLKKNNALDKFNGGLSSDKLIPVPTKKLSSQNDASSAVIVVEDFNLTFNSTDNEEMTLDSIIAKNTKSIPGQKRKSAEETFEPIYEQIRRSTRRKTVNSNKGRGSPEMGGGAVNENETVDEVIILEPARRGRRGRGKSNKASDGSTSRGRGRGSPSGATRPRARGATPSRARGRGRTSRNNRHSSYPTYSIGNTEDYPDMCDNQELFSTKSDAVQIIDDDDPLDNENEELSVKVYWQNVEVVRFKLRKFQKFTPIFQYFADKENVGYSKLLFMYNDTILKADDTPDSINYSIAKFIDGGIVSQDITGLGQHKGNEMGGLKIKFQCQNFKKPFETTIRPEDKLLLAMMKYAEHIETPIDRLKFYFDGDLITSKNSPQELDLEGGECIDVKIIS